MQLKTGLLPHQQKAVDKLIGLKIGALYMEMGTGKTRTALEMIQRRLSAGKIDRVLWLCPCSIKNNIARDVVKHCSDIDADHFQIHGIESLSGSERLHAYLMDYCSRGKCMLVVDESNLVKNSRAIRSIRITGISRMCPYRLILNGTPISKNEADMFAQWYILDWRVLGYQSFYSFAANHLEYDEKFKGKVRRVLNVGYLTDKIAPYSYMVKKDECLTLPDKKYKNVYFDLEYEQTNHYEFEKEMYLDTLISMSDDIGSAAIYRTFSALQQITSGRRITSISAEDKIEHEPFFEAPSENPRIKALLELIANTPNKIIVWCKFTHEIHDIVSVLSDIYGTDSVVEYYGEQNLKQREKSIATFTNTARFFIANKSCAGYGLNLQFCNNAIYYNNDWDWATRAQSEDRIHRIGQESDVVIYNIIARGTIDQRIVDCLDRKESLADCFRRDIKSKNAFKWMDGEDEVNDSQRDVK